MKKKAVIWDFDGTVMDTTDIIMASWQYTYNKLKGHDGDEKVIHKTFGELLQDSMAVHFPEFDTDMVVELYRSYHRDNFGATIKLFPGIRDTLEALKQQGYRQCLVTSRLARTTYEGLEAYGIRDYFEYVVTANDTNAHKPDPEPANIALEKLGITAEECIMLGDTKFDIGCAHNAGITAVLVGWTVALEDREFEDWYIPDIIVEKPEDILPLLEKLNEE